ncbi:response regulator [Neptunomonas sp.]|uniref:response regulator n=1 Tax=Neptunomonas sp. TaxID=1971898 RepID=UPI003565AA76
MNENHILLVDDDQELTELLSDYLEAEGVKVSVENSAKAALVRLQSDESFDLAVFDIMMPEMSGLELLQQLRPRLQLPVIMLTGRGGDIDRILGLEMGADDYLAKPCNPRELLARIRAVLRRAQQRPESDAAQLLTCWGVALDPSTREVSFGSHSIDFTSAEFNVLYQFMQHPGEILSKSKLTETVLHRSLTAYDRAIDVHVSRVRQKLAPFTGQKELIKTIRGEGYLFVRDNQ